MRYLAILGKFEGRNLHKTCYILNQHPLIYLMTKFHVIRKNGKSKTKNTFFRYFWDAILKI